MGRYTGKTCRLIFMLVITVTFFVVEIVTGYAGNSIALVSDSFNMLSDTVSLCVGLLAARLSHRRGSQRYSFGLARAEVVGALANAAFLSALLFSISAEAVKRLSRPERIDEPLVVLVVGALGLAVNVIGLLIFQDCRCLSASSRRDPATEEKVVMNGEAGSLTQPADSVKTEKTQSDSQPLNIRGVLLHVLNDALGSVVVVVASLLFYLRPLEPEAPCNWQCYVDPGLTLIMVAIIMSSAISLMKETTNILLQMTPDDLSLSTVLEDVCRLPGVISVHEVHVWELVKDRNVATLHVKVTSEFPDSQFKMLHSQIRDIFHKAGVHSVTVQLEVSEGELDSGHCTNQCTSSDCLKLSCCPLEPKPDTGGKQKQHSFSGDVAVNMENGQTTLLREQDTKQLDSNRTQSTTF